VDADPIGRDGTVGRPVAGPFPVPPPATYPPGEVPAPGHAVGAYPSVSYPAGSAVAGAYSPQAQYAEPYPSGAQPGPYHPPAGPSQPSGAYPAAGYPSGSYAGEQFVSTGTPSAGSGAGSGSGSVGVGPGPSGSSGSGGGSTAGALGGLPSPASAVAESLFGQGSVGLAFHDTAGRYVRVNDVLARLNGRPAAEHLGRSLPDMLGEIGHELASLLAQVLRTGEPVVDLEMNVVAGGPESAQTWLASWYPVIGPHGGPLGAVFVAVDATTRRLAQDAAARAEARTRLLAEAVATDVLHAGADGAFDGDMPRWRALTGQRRAESDGFGWLDAVHPADRDTVRRSWRSAVERAESFDAEFRVLGADGGERIATARALAAPGGTEWVGALTEVTDLRAAQTASATAAAQVRASGEQVEQIQRVTAALARAVTVDDVVAVVLDAGRALGATGRGVALIDEASDGLEFRALEGYSAQYVTRWTRVGLGAVHPAAEAVRGRRPVFLSGRDELTARWPVPDLVAAVNATDDVAWALLPLASGDRPLGVLSFGFPTAREFAADERSYLELLAQQCALALERALLFERALAQAAAGRAAEGTATAATAAAHRADARLSVVATVTAALAGSVADAADPVRALRALAEAAVVDLLDVCAVYLVDEAPPAAAGGDADSWSLLAGADGGDPASAWAAGGLPTGAGSAGPDWAGDAVRPGDPAADLADLGGAGGPGRTAGAAASDAPGEAGEELPPAAPGAGPAASGVSSGYRPSAPRPSDAGQSDAWPSEAWPSDDAAESGTAPPAEAPRRAAAQPELRRIAGALRAGLTGPGLPPSRPARWPAASPIGRAVATGRPQLGFVRDPGATPPTGPDQSVVDQPAARQPGVGQPVASAITAPIEEVRWADRVGAHSVVAAPILRGGRLAGVLTLVATGASAPLADSDLLLAAELAARAAGILDRAELAGSDRSGAAALRRRLAPARPDAPAGLAIAARHLPGEAGGEAGGDWFDVVDLGAGRAALVIGDVAGRGIATVAAMGALRAAVRTCARLDLPPHEVITLLDGVLLDLVRADPDGDRPPPVATCIYAIVETDSGRLTLASAGHPPPLVVAPDGLVSRLYMEVGPPLGAGRDDVKEYVVRLGPDSLLALFTDGLVAGRDGEFDAGVSRLAAALARPGGALGDLAEAAVGTLPPAASGATAPDDAALLLARLPPAPAGAPAAAEIPLTEGPAGLGPARASARAVLADWDLPADPVETAVLVLSELLGNAVAHGRAPIVARLRRLGDRVVVEVTDGGGRLPRRRHAEVDDEAGRGLELVAMLADRWGIRPTADGKVVWAEVEVPASPSH
jgi:serine phosphatase RsbU (regulator of sigma subunit)/PAS domain-containing protein/anti-sigma regulatory factor (Ser/Thr protein kinase)